MRTTPARDGQQALARRLPLPRARRNRHRIRGPFRIQIPSTAMNARAQVIHLGELSARLRHAARHLFETVLAPLGLFWLMLTLTNLTGGLIAALSWAVGVLLGRLLTRTPIPAVLWLTTGLLVIRTAIGYATGSVFLYFLQPTLQNFVIAFVLLATVGLRRPLLARLADDFCAFPVALTSNLRVQRFFRRVSLLWAIVFLTNGAATLWVLARATLGNFLMVTTAGSFSLVALAAGVSLLWFRRELRGEGIRLHFGTAVV
ncbi:MAG TPA: VC0807 family protein [Pseudonocardiaceae bacterium]|nr:VC0807 family protein [Pseudonocardiaceae bacterium]